MSLPDEDRKRKLRARYGRNLAVLHPRHDAWVAQGGPS